MGRTETIKAVLRDEMIMTAYANGYSVPIDTRPETGGHDAGILPMQLLLISLAGCAGLDVISILRKKQQKVTAFEIEVEGTRGDEHPKVYKDITIRFTISGHGVEPAAVERSIELSRDKYCGAWATLRHTAQIHYTYEIIEAEPEAEPL